MMHSTNADSLQQFLRCLCSMDAAGITETVDLGVLATVVGDCGLLFSKGRVSGEVLRAFRPRTFHHAYLGLWPCDDTMARALRLF